MYSPKISEELVPILYRLAKAQRIPMTELVDRMIRQSLIAAGTDLPVVKTPARPPEVHHQTVVRPDYTYRRAA